MFFSGLCSLTIWRVYVLLFAFFGCNLSYSYALFSAFSLLSSPVFTTQRVCVLRLLPLSFFCCFVPFSFRVCAFSSLSVFCLILFIYFIIFLFLFFAGILFQVDLLFVKFPSCYIKFPFSLFVLYICLNCKLQLLLLLFSCGWFVVAVQCSFRWQCVVAFSYCCGCFLLLWQDGPVEY